ncbi:MAG TPA: aminotransferase class V-fold PLP-dependent enzyme [Candidatus Polarisedimenticolaceae bacterium]
MTILDRRTFLAGSGIALATAAAAPRTFASVATQPNAWADVRASFRLRRDLIHLSSFFLVSHPKPVRDAVERYRDMLDADPFETVERHCFGKPEENLALRVKRAAASYLGGRPEEVALTQSTTAGLALVYLGLPLGPGQEILTTTHDHYVHHEASRLAAARAGATVRRVPLFDRFEELPAVTEQAIVARLREAIRPATRVLGITWVHSQSGLKLPLAAIAAAVREVNAGRPERERVRVVVDGVHGFGVEDVAVAGTGIDVFVSGTHKWIFGPRGTGLVWARAEVWAEMAPTIPTFDGLAPYEAWEKGEPPAGPPRADWFTPGGFHAFEHAWAVEAAFAFHASIGRARIAERIHALNARIKDGLSRNRRVRLWTPRSPDLSAGLVGFDVEGMATGAVVEGLLRRRVVASGSPYPRSVVRLAAGIMNTEEEIDLAVKAVAELSA